MSTEKDVKKNKPRRRSKRVAAKGDKRLSVGATLGKGRMIDQRVPMDLGLALAPEHVKGSELGTHVQTESIEVPAKPVGANSKTESTGTKDVMNPTVPVQEVGQSSGLSKKAGDFKKKRRQLILNENPLARNVSSGSHPDTSKRIGVTVNPLRENEGKTDNDVNPPTENQSVGSWADPISSADESAEGEN